ncbi:hypothetical protein TorRG33x02_336180 [Trema orientale]|uniref:Uncharacterized protein n=1 Tax=Trema orientale TaxID=63057 RepID=A0A2P5B0E7_TREOI|nr:hypothetical protein TorRG33x02_336180 [Trema orientale]
MAGIYRVRCWEKIWAICGDAQRQKRRFWPQGVAASRTPPLSCATRPLPGTGGVVSFGRRGFAAQSLGPNSTPAAAPRHCTVRDDEIEEEEGSGTS